MEKLDEEMEEEERNWAKEEAKKMLEQGEIDDYERLDKILSILSDMREFGLSYDLEELKKKQTKRKKRGR